MRLSSAFFAFFLVLAQSEARPARTTFISIPISRVPPSSSSADLPPVIVHQQHANRGIRRLELMSGSSQTSDDELLSNLRKRASTLAAHLQKRYNRGGVADALARLTHSSSTQSGNAFKAKNKTVDTHDNVTPAHKPTFKNSIGLDIQAEDLGYLGTVQIGTPPRDFLLLMDSGSADMWVGSEDCASDDDGEEGCGDHTFLGPKASSSYNNTGVEWSIEYGTGAVTGTLVKDHVAIGGLKLPAFTFGVAHKESREFTPDFIPFDGLVGLAKSLISRQHATTIVEALQERGLIKHAITSYKIPRLEDGKNDGELTFGAMNPAKYNPATLVTVPNINGLGFWEAAVGAVTVNGKDMGWKNRTAIFDTGTSLLIVPPADANAIHKLIPGAVFDDGWLVPCNVNASLALTLGGQAFSIDTRDLKFLPVDPDHPTGNCTSGITPGTVGPDFQWLVGDVFLKNVYMSTDVGTDKISFAKLSR